jgi:chitin disaccharide deacetylase
MKKLFICADDFGMTNEINAGIINLAQQGRVSAASCLVHGSAFRTGAAQLADTEVQLGLHLNLTEALGGTQYHQPLGKLIIGCFTGKISSVRIHDEIERQFDKFVTVFGRNPDYVDGHQHVHQFPVVRDCLLRVLSERYLNHLPWLRSTRQAAGHDFPVDSMKAKIIQSLGDTGLRTQCQAGQFKMNSGLFGVYGFEGGTHAFLKRLRTWVADFKQHDLIICHPAVAPSQNDVLGKQRQAEFLVLGGRAFAEMLQEQNATVVTSFDGIDNHFSYGTLLQEEPVTIDLMASICQRPVVSCAGKPQPIQIPDSAIN